MDSIMCRKREDIDNDRKKLRELAANNQRLDLESVSEGTQEAVDVTTIAKKLRKKGAIHPSDLRNLKNALFQSEDNISAFLNVHKALHGLVKELTGLDANKQILAAGCCCNISLGPVKTCHLLAEAAGTYLIIYLESQNDRLVETCAWAVGNLAASGTTVGCLLKAQGLIPKLLLLLQDNHQTNVADAASYALAHLIMSCDEILENNELHEIATHVLKSKHNSDYITWVIYILSSKETLDNIFRSHNLFNSTVSNLVFTVLEPNWKDQLIRVNCLIRIAANLCSPETLKTADGLLSEKFFRVMTTLLASQNKDIIKDCLWFLGNIYEMTTESTIKTTYISQIVQEISAGAKLISKTVIYYTCSRV